MCEMKEDNTVDYMLNYAGNSVKINEALEAYTQSVSYLWCVIVAVYSVHWHGLIESGLVQTGSVLQREKKAC